MLRWGEFQIRSRRVGPPSIELFKSLTHNLGMKSNVVRTSIACPVTFTAGSMGSYRVAGIERFNASSSSQRALVSFARILHLRSWPNISLPSGGRKAMDCCMTVAGSSMRFCAHGHNRGCE
jgi:hypothetical protein